MLIRCVLSSLSNGKLGTPLSCAAYHGHDHIVSCLLGRDVNCNGSYADLKVNCMLYLYPNKTYMSFKMSAILQNYTSYIVGYAYILQKHLNIVLYAQVSPLLLATQQGHIKAVKVLLEYPRIDVTLTNEAGHNALAEAIVKGHK